MDDAIDSVTSIAAGIQVVQQLMELMAKAGFCLYKWLSNAVKVLRLVDNLSSDHLPVERTLGAY